ncbi:CDP-glycerol glycerophosphotransferase family protein [Aequorivita xiaoshiensis]|uniref:CDP-glycerol glycerophosphotransferase family protein n=1 Tax=Aequorivita xiaoshiensis TaxID=2874476 RepID=A0A9X1R5G2_9FLAO|nr:CDP-glycerol glycerophosphotransferase family protein [Aequorivita xiaoshiensis]MCG2431379.1 CDP-glycerol glycerophosphotransferase family protein [Aequorivita xiaoshiensis]
MSHKIAIIFLDEIHHIYHFVSVAVELAKSNQVHILTHSRKNTFLYESLKKLNDKNVVVEKMPTVAFRAFTDRLKGRQLPRKGFWIKKHKKYILTNFDAIIFTDYYHKYLLKVREDRIKPKFIFLEHGTPGRAYAYNKDILDFDFHLQCGMFHNTSLKEMQLLNDEYKVTGYPKLDVVKLDKPEPIFTNNKPTVLYNPHFTPPLSSWHFMGLRILEFFYKLKDYNLIFAPHINLFNKVGGDDPAVIPQKYHTADNIHIDLGSDKSVNMTYTKAADIYIGDVSSQVYEFMTNPRPCIFLNPEGVDYKDDINYRFWQCGDVINSITELKEALKSSKENHQKTYKSIQEKITSENYYTEEGSTPSERAASAINEYLDNVL